MNTASTIIDVAPDEIDVDRHTEDLRLTLSLSEVTLAVGDESMLPEIEELEARLAVQYFFAMPTHAETMTIDPKKIDRGPAMVEVTVAASNRAGESCWGPTTCMP